MIRRRIARIATVAALITAGGLTAASPASAETIGTVVSGPGTACSNGSVSNTNVKVCYQTNGDYLFVYDGEPDGRSAYGIISWPEDRTCRNAAGNGTWVRCNFNLEADGAALIYQGYTKDNQGAINIRRNWTAEGHDTV